MTSPGSRPPRFIRVIAVVAIVFFCLPFVGLLWRTPWSRVFDVLGDETSREALWLSLRTSIAAALVSVVFGVPLAWVLATVDFRGRNVVRALCLISMVLPPVVGGISLIFSMGRSGLFGRWLDEWFGFRFTFSTWGVIIAQVFVAMPFLVLSVEGALRQVDPRPTDAARTLGASSWYAFRRVTIPSIGSALIAGTVLAWARAFGEFGATITFAGNYPGTTRTLSIATYSALENDQGRAMVLSLMMILVSFVVLIALRDRWLGSEASR
jgi:molybdate transport system permease protein